MNLHWFFSTTHPHLIGFFSPSPVDVVLFCGLKGKEEEAPLAGSLTEVFSLVFHFEKRAEGCCDLMVGGWGWREMERQAARMAVHQAEGIRSRVRETEAHRWQ